MMEQKPVLVVDKEAVMHESLRELVFRHKLLLRPVLSLKRTDTKDRF
jgi:hypothetical protein